MKLAHFILITIFAKENENKEEIKKILEGFLPFDLQKEKIKIEEETVEGIVDKKIKIYKVDLKKTKHTNKFIENLMSKLNSQQKDLLIEEIETRLDERMHFYLRFDKEKLLVGKQFLCDHGNCLHIKMTIAAYPRTREKAIEVLKEYILNTSLINHNTCKK